MSAFRTIWDFVASKSGTENGPEQEADHSQPESDAPPSEQEQSQSSESAPGQADDPSQNQSRDLGQDNNQTKGDVPTPLLVLEAIIVIPTNESITAGAQRQYAATGEYNDGSIEDITASVQWSSSAPDVVAIDSGGAATAQSVSGTATITATDPKSGVSGSTAATVALPQASGLQSITVTPANPTIGTGAKQQFTATGNYPDGPKDLTGVVLWSSSAPSIISIDGGLAKVLVAGNATIKATDGATGISGEAEVSAYAQVEVLLQRVYMQTLEKEPGPGSYSYEPWHIVRTTMGWVRGTKKASPEKIARQSETVDRTFDLISSSMARGRTLKVHVITVNYLYGSPTEPASAPAFAVPDRAEDCEALYLRGTDMGDPPEGL